MRLGCRTVVGQQLAPCSVRGMNTARSHAFRQTATRPTSKRIVAPRSGAVRAQAMFGGLGNLLKGDPAKKTQERLQPIVDQVNKLESQMQGLSDDQLRKITVSLQERAQSGTPLDTLLPEAFAVVREASVRALGLRPFDVQIMGGVVLHEGAVAEMRTGEGKTLVAVLPAFLNALSGKGVHIVTVNDYLARRDSEWVGQVHKFLGLSVGLIQAGMEAEDRRNAYAADITYVTNSELGFDYLRDNLAQEGGELVLQRKFNYCIIDEVDSILIDEARTPLIISGQADKPSDKYTKATKLAQALARDVHYTVDEKQRNVLLTEDGYQAAEDVLAVADLYDPREQWASFLLNAIKAEELFKREVNYIVKGGEIVIVDEFTGRTMPGRRWSDGLHQAIESKEGVEINNETVTLASISYQNFFRAYPKLSGMSGTAATEIDEFSNIYNMSVQIVPTNKPVAREDSNDVVFRNTKGKWNAVTTEIARMHKTGRPVLVGTTSVETSELVAKMLEEKGIKHEVLNAKPENVERESEIVAQSGRMGAVTIATNMAGRGTDIILGGNAEFMARLKLREFVFPEVVSVVDAEGNPFTKGAAAAGWKVSPDLFPVELTDDQKKAAKAAAAAAAEAWGKRQLTPLEAEDRLAVACEKAPTDDAVLGQLREVFQDLEATYADQCNAQKKQVTELGGLHVVGTERHESRRIDNQLRGRTGRQGDPGSTRFFLSLEDNIFRIFGGDKIKGLMTAFRVDDLPIESGMLTDALDNAQRKVESYFFDIRKQLWEYDQVLNSQRDRIYSERRKALLSDSLDSLMVEYSEETMSDILEANIPKDQAVEDWMLDALATKVGQYCFILENLTGDVLRKEAGEGQNFDYEKLRAFLHAQGKAAYEEKVRAVEAVQEGLMPQAQRFFLLTQIDNLWKEHLQAMQFLRQAVGLRGYGQRDPLTEYKLEGFELFKDMLARVRRNVIYNVYVFTPTRMDRVDDKAGKPVQNGGAQANGGSRGKKFKENRGAEAKVAAAAE